MLLGHYIRLLWKTEEGMISTVNSRISPIYVLHSAVMKNDDDLSTELEQYLGIVRELYDQMKRDGFPWRPKEDPKTNIDPVDGSNPTQGQLF